MSVTIHLPESDFTEASGVFALLAVLWAKEVDLKTLNLMSQQPFAKAWKQAGGKLPGKATAEWVESLAVDYCQLLIGPKNHASPVQSIWDQSRYEGDASASMSKYMELIDGFEPCVAIPDHVAVQLQYAGVLMGMADQSKRKLIQGLATAFARDHLAWTADLFERIEAQAETDFYRGLASLSHRYLFSK